MFFIQTTSIFYLFKKQLRIKHSAMVLRYWLKQLTHNDFYKHEKTFIFSDASYCRARIRATKILYIWWF